ncbi:hypothetical protein [Pararhizobium sp. PWRC1-1]|uniref:hypothetical protein n=1 Tax=Pararhizobium sp. PWRC1-1 TaxID=2804566 RepID=UPI003CF10884
MTHTILHSRQQAEIAFSHSQSQFFARGHAVEELESIIDAREAKTARLREARLAKEEQERADAIQAPTTKRAKKA